jgi:hypothetical protein
MRKIGIMFLFMLSFIGTYAQSTSETRALSKFSGVRAGEAIDVYLKKGDKESAKIEVEGVNLSDVLTEVSGNYLRIQMRSGNYKGRKMVKVYVTYVDNITRMQASSASNIFTEGILKTTTLDIVSASAATIELQLEAETVTVDVASAADVTIEGKAKSLTLEASSAGSVDAYNFECEKVDATVTSAGSAKVAQCRGEQRRKCPLSRQPYQHQYRLQFGRIGEEKQLTRTPLWLPDASNSLGGAPFTIKFSVLRKLNTIYPRL